MRLLRRILALAVAAPVLALAAPATAADDADRVTWGVAPAAEDAADGRVSFRYELDPGAVVEDFLEVTNYSDRAVTFQLLSSDGVVGPDGAFDLLPADVAPEATGTWIDVQESVELEPQSSAVVPFTLTVPEDALPGDHPGGIAASVGRVGETEDGPLVGLDTRVGARVHLRVSGDLVPQVSVTDLGATYTPSWNPLQPGTLHLDYTVVNDGNVRLGSTQTIAADGLLGLSAGADGAILAQQREILPGQETRVSTTVDGVWPLGPLTSTVTAAQVVVGDDVVDVPLTVAQAGTTTWAVPWAQLAVLVLAVALVVWRVRLRRKQRAAIERARAEGAREAALPDVGTSSPVPARA